MLLTHTPCFVFDSLKENQGLVQPLEGFAERITHKQQRRAAAAEWTYSSGLSSLTAGVGHGRTRLHRSFPAAQEGEEQLREEATAIIRLPGRSRME